VRAHGNFAEYTPFAVLLMLLVELQGGPAVLLHIIGLLLLLGCAVHACGISASPENAIAGGRHGDDIHVFSAGGDRNFDADGGRRRGNFMADKKNVVLGDFSSCGGRSEFVVRRHEMMRA